MTGNKGRVDETFVCRYVIRVCDRDEVQGTSRYQLRANDLCWDSDIFLLLENRTSTILGTQLPSPASRYRRSVFRIPVGQAPPRTQFRRSNWRFLSSKWAQIEKRHGALDSHQQSRCWSLLRSPSIVSILSLETRTKQLILLLKVTFNSSPCLNRKRNTKGEREIRPFHPVILYRVYHTYHYPSVALITPSNEVETAKC